jgi:catechol 2,3-dioxygenase-like lactoylglutathione lyase family enzyme
MRLGRVILFAKDVARLGAFYRDVLGFAAVETGHEAAEWMLLETGGAELALHRVPDPWNAGIEITDPPSVRHASPHKPVFVVDDLRAIRDRLLARGVVALDTGPANPPGELLRCDFVDLEGNVFQISGPGG